MYVRKTTECNSKKKATKKKKHVHFHTPKKQQM